MNPFIAPPQGVPTLTEVVQWSESDAPWTEAPLLPAVTEPPQDPLHEAPVVASMPPWPSEEQLTQTILSDVQRQIDLMLDYRMRELLAPLLARATDSLIRDTRHELASTLRDIVARAVAQEISRHRTR